MYVCVASFYLVWVKDFSKYRILRRNTIWTFWSRRSQKSSHWRQKNKILDLLSQFFKFYHRSPKQLTRLKMLLNLVIVIDVSTVISDMFMALEIEDHVFIKFIDSLISQLLIYRSFKVQVILLRCNCSQCTWMYRQSLII